MHAAVVHRRGPRGDRRLDPRLSALEDYELFLRVTRMLRGVSRPGGRAVPAASGRDVARDTLTMLRMALFVLHEQRPYLAEHPGAIDAYEAGLVFWKRHYGKQPIRSVPSHLAAGPLRQAGAPAHGRSRSRGRWRAAGTARARRSGVTWSARAHAATSQRRSRWLLRPDSWHRRAPARGNRLSRAAGLPRLAGSDRPLQAERDRRVLGCPAAAAPRLRPRLREPGGLGAAGGSYALATFASGATSPGKLVASSVFAASHSVVSSQDLVKRVYFRAS